MKAGILHGIKKWIQGGNPWHPLVDLTESRLHIRRQEMNGGWGEERQRRSSRSGSYWGWVRDEGSGTVCSLLTVGLKEALLTSTWFWKCYIILFSLGRGLWLVKKEADPHLLKLLQIPFLPSLQEAGLGPYLCVFWGRGRSQWLDHLDG